MPNCWLLQEKQILWKNNANQRSNCERSNKRSDWGKIINLQNNEKRNIVSKNGNSYIIGKGTGNTFTLTNINGEPIYTGASTIFGDLDDLKLRKKIF